MMGIVLWYINIFVTHLFSNFIFRDFFEGGIISFKWRLNLTQSRKFYMIWQCSCLIQSTKQNNVWSTVQKMKFSIMDFFSKCHQIGRRLRIWSHLLQKSLMENFIFCAVITFRTSSIVSNWCHAKTFVYGLS